MKLSELIQICVDYKIDKQPALELFARNLREADRIPTGGRGYNGADITALDAVRFVIACMATDRPKDAVKAERRFSNMQNRSGYKLDYFLSKLVINNNKKCRVIIKRNQEHALVLHPDEGEIMFMPVPAMVGYHPRKDISSCVRYDIFEDIAKKLNGPHKPRDPETPNERRVRLGFGDTDDTPIWLSVRDEVK